MVTSYDVASDEARRKFDEVKEAVCKKYARFKGVDVEKEATRALELCRRDVGENFRLEGEPMRADQFLRWLAMYWWRLCLRNCEMPGDDLREPLPGFGARAEKGEYKKPGLQASPEHERFLTSHHKEQEAKEAEEARRANEVVRQSEAQAQLSSILAEEAQALQTLEDSRLTMERLNEAQRLERRADDGIVRQLWAAIQTDFRNFNEDIRLPFEVHILKKNYKLFYGAENTDLSDKIGALTMAAADMMPYTTCDGEWFVIGLYTSGGSGTDPTRIGAARQLFRIMWQWAAAVREIGTEAGTLFDKLNAFYASNPPMEAKGSKELLSKLTNEQKEFFDKIKTEVVSLLVNADCSKTRLQGLDDIIMSRVSGMREVGLKMTNVADLIADWMMTALPPSKEVNEATQWLATFQG